MNDLLKEIKIITDIGTQYARKEIMNDTEIIKSELAEIFVQLSKVEDKIDHITKNQVALKELLIIMVDNQKKLTDRISMLTDRAVRYEAALIQLSKEMKEEIEKKGLE